jgi:hypothetical protein
LVIGDAHTIIRVARHVLVNVMFVGGDEIESCANSILVKFGDVLDVVHICNHKTKPFSANSIAWVTSAYFGQF